MKTFAISAWAVALTAFATLSMSAEMPFNQAQFDATRAAGRPVAVVFHADWCPTCRAQAPVLKQLTESKELESVTLFVANFDTPAIARCASPRARFKSTNVPTRLVLPIVCER